MDLGITIVFSEHFLSLSKETKDFIIYKICNKLNIKIPVINDKWLKGKVEYFQLTNYEDISNYISVLRVE